MSEIKLAPMSEAQFAEYLELILPDYAAERAAADHISLDAAEQYAWQQYVTLLPEGRNTPSHILLAIAHRDSHASMGGVWLSFDIENKTAFLYNISVSSQYRRRGVATATLGLLAEIARESGCVTLGLNVFSSNEGAMALYRRCGFAPVSMYWNKAL